MRRIESVLGSTSQKVAPILTARQRLSAVSDAVVGAVASCQTVWMVRDESGRYWRTACVLEPEHDGRCVDRRGRRGPA